MSDTKSELQLIGTPMSAGWSKGNEILRSLRCGIFPKRLASRSDRFLKKQSRAGVVAIEHDPYSGEVTDFRVLSGQSPQETAEIAR